MIPAVQNNPTVIAENGSHVMQHASSVTPEAVALFTVDDVARQLKLSRSKIYGLIAQGKLPVHRLPAIRVSQQDLHEFLAGCRSHRSQPSDSKVLPVRLKHLR
jgi:excisionase family DNA binding protein